MSAGPEGPRRADATMHIDLEAGTVTVGEGGATHSLASPEGFAAVSKAWLRAGWDAKYVYGFTWLGRPVIQLPEDMIRMQEVVQAVRPDLVVETGVAHGGMLVFYATLLRVLGGRRVVGVDLEIRPPNRQAIVEHALADMIRLVEGDSTDPRVVGAVAEEIREGDRVLVALDSRHTKDHVLGELEAYSRFVSPGSFIVAMDGIMGELVGAPRSGPDWGWNNPRAAAEEFVERHPEFEIQEPGFAFNEGNVRDRVTYWPGAFIRRLR